ncbi:hypothetical protein PMAYCL1PPCAC_29337 [Pristionchus mayeri]|uniref:Uncharacterized protein n=1 Tax=Pristionchus mayeri TaxID=1317129 RepID=A0AAN5IAS3_9BILA|nr:hypothetical protein PMAYCL1PPCAC_29337 [Pristionchus mayeri]
MATRSPPPLVSAPHGPSDRPTTTISTIVVKSGEEAFLTVGLLQSGEFARLRIDSMRPPLLSIGKDEEENTHLLNIHQNLLKKLSMKEDECEALLARAAALPAEKDEDEAKVYSAMAVSLDWTWRQLKRRLGLRENLLVDTSTFYRLLASHQEVSRVCISAISSLSQSQSPDGLARQIGVSVNEMVSITARAMEVGSSVMGQLRILGELSENEEREEEIYQAMLLIETAMLKMASEWSRVEDSWVDEKKKRLEMNETGEVDKELEEIGRWLAHAVKRLKASTEEGMKTIMAEAEEQRTHLITIISQTEDDRKLAEAGELARGVEELLALTKAALNKGTRLRNFFVSATNMYHQLVGMERDMEKANESMAGELAPLARQKGRSLKEEADIILERERVTHDERRMVMNKRNEIMEKIEQIERLAREKSDSGKMQARENLRRGREWLVREAEPWMERNGEMGGTTESIYQFVLKHSQFGENIVANDAAIQFALNESSRLSEEEQRSSREFEDRYTRLKKEVEERLLLGKTFQQVKEFARELESSFDSLEQLIDQKAEHSERGLVQMGKVFEMIEETLGQERSQGERFISSVSHQEKSQPSLKTEEAKKEVREILLRHERRFTLMNEKWNRWQVNKKSMVEVSRVMDEVQMWQEEAEEIIRLWDERRIGEKEDVRRRVEEVKRRMEDEKERIHTLKSTVDDEMTVMKMEERLKRQREIEEKMQRVQTHSD